MSPKSFSQGDLDAKADWIDKVKRQFDFQNAVEFFECDSAVHMKLSYDTCAVMTCQQNLPVEERIARSALGNLCISSLELAKISLRLLQPYRAERFVLQLLELQSSGQAMECPICFSHSFSLPHRENYGKHYLKLSHVCAFLSA